MTTAPALTIMSATGASLAEPGDGFGDRCRQAEVIEHHDSYSANSWSDQKTMFRMKFLHSNIIGIFQRLIAEQSSYAKTIWSILSRPTMAGRLLLGHEAESTANALKFYAECFGISFVVASYATYLSHYSGAVEWREAARLIIQVCAGLLLLICASRFARTKVEHRGIIDAVLYVDGLYILLGWPLVLIPQFLQFAFESSSEGIDLLQTEYSRCLSADSLPYWFLIGPYDFFSYASQFPQSTYRILWDSYAEILATIPFCWLYGMMLKARYEASAILHSTLAFAAFVLVVTMWDKSIAHVRNATTANSTCRTSLPLKIRQTYSPELIAKQVALKIEGIFRNQKEGKVNIAVRARGGNVHVKFPGVYKPGPFEEGMIKGYCDGGEFQVARYLGVTVVVEYDNPFLGLPREFPITETDCVFRRKTP